MLICLFTVEMFFKVVAMGFALHPNAYLRDRWNWLDFSVVCAGWVDLAATWAGDANSASVLSSLRAVRVLRPLRTLKQLPSMQALIASMLGSIPQMGNVVGILLFFLVVSGILGVQLFSGLLRHQCHVAGPDGVWTSTGDVCNPFGDALTYRCPPPAECRCGGSGLPPRLVVGSAGLRRSDCLQSDNPNFGITHFDHFWGAFITIFQSITLEGWTDNMYWAQDGVHTFVWIYYVLVVTFGAFLVVQLFLAVLSDAFNSESAKQAGGAPAAAPEYKDVDGDGIMDLDMTGRPWLQRRCYALVSAPAFRHSTHSAIVLNTVVMCCEYYGQPAEEERVLHALNYSLTGIFAVELGAKLVAMGPVNCMRDVFNRFDAMVVVLSLLEVGLDLGGKSFVNLAVLRTFRLMRLVRVFKLVRALKGLNHLMRALLDSLRSVSSLALLLLLLVLIYALLGLQLFGGIYTPPPRGRNSNYGGAEVPSANFDSFALACISIFVVLSGENWNEVYFDASNGLQTLSGKAADRELATFYFLSLFVLGNYIIVNLFTAIILNRLMDDETDQLTDEQKMSHVEGTGKIVFSFGSLVHVADEHAQRIQDGAGSRAVLAELHARPAACARALQPSERSSTNSLTQFIYKRAQRLSRNSTLISLNGGKASPPGLSTMAERPSGEDRSQHGHVRKGEARDDQTLGRSFTGAKGELLSALSSSALPDASPAVAEAGADRSLCLFSRAHPFRRACVHMLRDPNFDRVILTLICASSISLAYDTPTQTALTTRVLYVLNYFFTVAFAVETLIKVVALGFIWPAPSAYLRSAWNVMDFAIVSVSVLLLVLEEVGGTVVVQLAWLKAMRVVRALRPLRAANRISGMKKVVSSLFMAVPQCANVSLLMSAVVLVFAILGVQLFKGRFYECTDLASQTREECLANGGRWVNPPFGNFDHIGNGVLVLVEMVGLEGWPNVMFRGMYATEIGRAPVRDDRSGRVAYALYFIVRAPRWFLARASARRAVFSQNAHRAPFLCARGAQWVQVWIFAGAFLVWSLFIGVVLDTFNDLRKKDDGTAFMTAEQQAWMEAQRTVYAMRPLRQATCPSSNPARQRAFRLIQSTTFEVAVLSAICANAVVMMLQWHDAPPRYALALQVLNYMFSIAFLAEMMLKLVALGVRQYVHNGWNAFDGLLVSLSVVDLTLELAGDSIATPLNPNILRVLRMFRVVRLLRAVKTAKGLRTLLVTLWSSLPALQNVGLLLGLVMYIYAIAGMYLFSDLPYGECLNRHANFRGFWIALLTLFRCSTGESWNCIMHDAMGGDWADNASRCAAGDEGTCGSTVVAAIYFLSYWILGQAILLNLVIGVILENFSAIGSENRPITVEQLEVRAPRCRATRKAAYCCTLRNALTSIRAELPYSTALRRL